MAKIELIFRFTAGRVSSSSITAKIDGQNTTYGSDFDFLAYLLKRYGTNRKDTWNYDFQYAIPRTLTGSKEYMMSFKGSGILSSLYKSPLTKSRALDSDVMSALKKQGTVNPLNSAKDLLTTYERFSNEVDSLLNSTGKNFSDSYKQVLQKQQTKMSTLTKKVQNVGVATSLMGASTLNSVIQASNTNSARSALKKHKALSLDIMLSVLRRKIQELSSGDEMYRTLLPIASKYGLKLS